MQTIAQSERKVIVFAGLRNAGKSSVMNAVAGQEASIVSPFAGTTTDPVRKAMELASYGPVLLTDTAGLDDEGAVGNLRVSTAQRMLLQADLIVYIIDGSAGYQETDSANLKLIKQSNTPCIGILNKADLPFAPKSAAPFIEHQISYISYSSINGDKNGLVHFIGANLPAESSETLLGGMLHRGDIVIMVVPIDLGAPKGRLIKPQVYAIRESLDGDAIVIVCKDKELRSVISRLNEPPKLIITDSQAVMRVLPDVPKGTQLTTFSILSARFKGDLAVMVDGLKVIPELEDGDTILIAEACTHHEGADDIGRVKIPRWLANFTKKDLKFEFSRGNDFPDTVSQYKLIIHCGACMLTQKAMHNRLRITALTGTPLVNYGVLISYLQGAMPSVIEPFPEAILAWNELPEAAVY
ncbi:MAG: [FeFe] hydrogenase H-cluster maturation GTPase HydF [Ignavibacteriales bacterium]|nr:MAG: [FeFe] hydrogenase H-cluster maturation GTPase HydF [Ignavibacteriales bacterium]